VRRTNEQVVKDCLECGLDLIKTGQGLIDYAQTICIHPLTKVKAEFVQANWPEGGFTKYTEQCGICGKHIKES
jgi:hypothetical protein